MLFKDRAIIRLDTVDSSNNYAANLVKLSSPPEGTVITAQEQTEGKGQRNAYWESNHSENLLCSIILYPHFLLPENQFFLSQIISIAVQETIENQLDQSVYIKWPNDVIAKGKKIAGILIQANWMEGRMSSAIVGIGINLNQQSFTQPKAISVKNILSKDWNVDDCLMAVLARIEKYYLKLQSGNYIDISRTYKEKLYKLGQVARFIYQEEEIDAMITGVDQQGRLRLYTAKGDSLCCNLKEISMIL